MSARRERLTRRLDRIEEVRAELLEELGAMPPEARAARPIADKWSIDEIVEHLVLSEDYVLRDFDPERTPRLRRTPANRLTYGIVMFVLRFDIPVGVPSPRLAPTGGRTFGELAAAWRENHRVLRETLDALDGGGLRAPFAVHPVAGPMTPGQALAVLDVHLRRHVRQIRKRQRLLADRDGDG